MNTHLYRSLGIYDDTPTGVARHVRRQIGFALDDLNNFSFAPAKKKLVLAQTLMNALTADLILLPGKGESNANSENADRRASQTGEDLDE